MLDSSIMISQLSRHQTLGSTDLMRITRGEWLDLYLEKTGQASPKDLSYVWKPRLGLATEALHAWWHEMTEEVALADPDVGRRPDDSVRFRHADRPPHHCTSIDRWVIADEPEVLELKHTNERHDLRSCAEYYMPQLQWQLYVLALPRLRFSIIRGNNEPVWGYVEADAGFAQRLVTQADAFWWHVTEQVSPRTALTPEARTEIDKAAKTIKVNGLRGYDMHGDNEWAVAAGDFIRDKVAAEGLKASEATLKGMIPKDAGTISGAGVTFKRDARGALRCTIDDDVADYYRRQLQAMTAIVSAPTKPGADG